MYTILVYNLKQNNGAMNMDRLDKVCVDAKQTLIRAIKRYNSYLDSLKLDESGDICALSDTLRQLAKADEYLDNVADASTVMRYINRQETSLALTEEHNEPKDTKDTKEETASEESIILQLFKKMGIEHQTYELSEDGERLGSMYYNPNKINKSYDAADTIRKSLYSMKQQDKETKTDKETAYNSGDTHHVSVIHLNI